MIMICIWTITLDDYNKTAKITKLVLFFSSTLYIGIVNRDKNGCNYNCPAEIDEVFGRLVIFAQILKVR